MTEASPDTPDGLVLKEVSGIVSSGPAPEVVELTRWAAWRWAGRRVRLLRTASPDRIVPLPSVRPPAVAVSRSRSSEARSPGGRPGEFRSTVLRVPPAGDDIGEIVPLLSQWTAPGGSALVLVADLGRIAEVVARVEAVGMRCAAMPRGWNDASRGGRVVVGSRAAAWAPAPELCGAVVLDAHEEAYREESVPTWDAVTVAEERARRAGAPFVAVTACPTVELLDGRDLHSVSRAEERQGWAPVVVVDLSTGDPRSGTFTRPLIKMLDAAEPAAGRQMICVINRRGRSSLVVCSACRKVARCSQCGSITREDNGDLVCALCHERRPVVCADCGATRLRKLRPGVARVADELRALLKTSVVEVTGETPPGVSDAAEVIVGTEAVLHRVPRAAAVAFLDLDVDLMAPHFGAGAHSLSLLARASRIVGGRARGGRVLVQTRIPDHPVIASAVHADTSLFARDDRERRRALRLPPFAALARLSGDGAGALVERLSIESAELGSGRFLLRAPSHQELCDALAESTAERAARGRVRIEVDPLRV